MKGDISDKTGYVPVQDVPVQDVPLPNVQSETDESSSLNLSFPENIYDYIVSLLEERKIFVIIAVVGVIILLYYMYSNYFQSSTSKDDIEEIDDETDNMLVDLDASLSNKIKEEDENQAETDDGNMNELEEELKNLKDYNETDGSSDV